METQPWTFRAVALSFFCGWAWVVGHSPVIECHRHLPAGHCYSPLPYSSPAPSPQPLVWVNLPSLRQPGRYMILMSYPVCSKQRAVEETEVLRVPAPAPTRQDYPHRRVFAHTGCQSNHCYQVLDPHDGVCPRKCLGLPYL